MSDKSATRGDEAIWRWFWRAIVAAGVVVIGLSGAFYIYTYANQPSTITYSEFLITIERHNVDELILGEQQAEGLFRDGPHADIGRGRLKNRFRVNLPRGPETRQALIELLQKNDIPFELTSNGSVKALLVQAVVGLFVVAVAAAWFCIWIHQFVQLMLFSDGDFPGRWDKPLWVGLFLLVSPLAPFLFLFWKLAYLAMRASERSSPSD